MAGGFFHSKDSEYKAQDNRWCTFSSEEETTRSSKGQGSLLDEALEKHTGSMGHEIGLQQEKKMSCFEKLVQEENLRPYEAPLNPPLSLLLSILYRQLSHENHLSLSLFISFPLVSSDAEPLPCYSVICLCQHTQFLFHVIVLLSISAYPTNFLVKKFNRLIEVCTLHLGFNYTQILLFYIWMILVQIID